LFGFSNDMPIGNWKFFWGGCFLEAQNAERLIFLTHLALQKRFLIILFQHLGLL